MNLKDKIRVISDFPKEGIRFKDITTLLKDGQALRETIEQLALLAEEMQPDIVVGPEARGFVIGTPLAYHMGKGFVPIRKKGKLPCETLKGEYKLEYGTDALEIHKDALEPGQKVVIADDLLATGGTIETCINLVEQAGAQVVGVIFLIELTYLSGREVLHDYAVKSLIKF
ncbi:adenine phosphoribosyltransferase [Metallumcola ferriviriculae]|uniref:Adenine phosphoribosyltransferase n=1 Tax=Metallumcola ferriviriculae TaxID=3039180 RepID=A0AAU0UQ29_9FIRM|nr:adenine phosphoribosyltransferase [Desulfitibacteraceae bacterium MK1]